MRIRPGVALLAAGVLALAVAAWHGHGRPSTTPTVTATTLVSPAQQGDARITSCGPGATAEVTITNSGRAEAAYRVEVDYRDTCGTTVSIGILEGRVGAGRTRTANAPGSAARGVAICAIADVWRI